MTHIAIETEVEVRFSGFLLYMYFSGVFMQPGNCMATVGDECTAGIGEFLQHVLFQILAGKHCASTRYLYNEPRREKTGLRGFRPGPTQTGLYKLRKELEA